MLFKIKKKFKTLYERVETKLYIYSLKKTQDQSKVVFIQSPEHGNLGDHLISVGIRELIKKKYPTKKCVEFSGREYDIFKDNIEQITSSKDIIILVGGGNFGNLYIEEEERRRCVIKKFPNNEIIIMPVTITYTDNEVGETEKKISQKIYNAHRNLTIFCREEKSFNIANCIFNGNKIILSPDSANALEQIYSEKIDIKRNGALFCLRNDKEKIINNENIDIIKKVLKGKNIFYEITDTVIKKRVTKKTRTRELEILAKKFRSSEIVITDRLHGMILGMLTKTPTIVFKSLDHKITESYKWYKEYNYIFYIENEKEIGEVLKKALSLKVEKNKFPTKQKLETKFLKN